MEQYGKSEHVFDIDAEPEPVPVECASDDVNNDVVDDGFGPVGDGDDFDDDYDNGLDFVSSLYCMYVYVSASFTNG